MIQRTLLILLALCRFCTSAPAHGPSSLPTSEADAPASQHLAAEMDCWPTTVVYDDFMSGGMRFYPTNWQGDIADIELDERCLEDVEQRNTTLRLTYAPSKPSGWAAITWAYPDRPGPNWGEAPGRTLTGARRLRGLIRGREGGAVVELSIGGINREPFHDAEKPHQDEFGPVRERITLTQAWQPFELAIPANVARRNPVRVIGGFTCAFSTAHTPDGCTIYLDDVRWDDDRTNDLRFIRSYVPTADPHDDPIRNASFLYDNCLALLAFVQRGNADSLRRARLLADSLVWAQTHDRAGRFTSRPWRNAYACGPLADEWSNTARLPGIYDSQHKRMLEDRYAVSCDTGNQAWAIIALLSAHEVLEAGRAQDDPYLRAALRAARWIEANCRVDDALGGYSGGLEGWEQTAENPDGPTKLGWRSAEHCIDLCVAFSKLATALKAAGRVDPERWADQDDGQWNLRAEHARKFVLAMWNANGSHFWTGVGDGSVEINRKAIPLDVQTWSLLALGHDSEFRRTIGWDGPPEVPPMLRWVEAHCRETGSDGASGYRFSDRGTGIWPEGCGQVAACYQYLDLPDRACTIREQIASFRTDSGGIPAAWAAVVETGFLKDFGPDEQGRSVVQKWRYPQRSHVGATAWFLLSDSNPYWLEGRPATQSPGR